MRNLLFILFLLIQVSIKAQEHKPEPDTSFNPYSIYERQFEQLLVMRGVPNIEIKKILKEFKEYNITSDEKFAETLSKLYPSEKGIGVLCYFFNKDTLFRIFFEPGIVKEKKIFIIRKDELIQLGNDINHILGLYKKSTNRIPEKRGLIVNHPPQSPNTNYESIIKSASKLLLPDKLDTSYHHLLILPALNIGTIPFSILTPYKDSLTLIDRCSFTIVPSIIDLISLRYRILKLTSPEWSGDLSLDFDNAYDLNDSPTIFTLSNPLFISNPAFPKNTIYNFPNLPGAKNEIDSAKRFATNYTLLEGITATKDSVIKHLESSDLVYFATHGIADDEKPMEKSFLVLSGDDPFLTAKNIMDLRNSKTLTRFPEMVILSACQTGLGKPMEAGIAGLARSFLLAGSIYVIMSLWNVDDQATAYLMSRFIFYLQEPNKFMPSEPLRKAMLDTRRKYDLPAQWASFSVFGIDF